jgi:hypothetical protein
MQALGIESIEPLPGVAVVRWSMGGYRWPTGVMRPLGKDRMVCEDRHHPRVSPVLDRSPTNAIFVSNQSNHEMVHQLMPLALGIESTVGCHESLQALPGISYRTCSTEIVGEAFEHKGVATWRQWKVWIFAPDFVHIRIVLFRRRSIWDRNSPHNPIVIDTSTRNQS